MRQIILFVLFSFLIACSDKSDDLSKTCSISDPLNEITWLKELVSTFEKRASPAGAQIVQYTYKEQCVFLIDDCVNCSDNLIRVFDYDQDLLCEFGGIAGLNTCVDFEKEATNRQVLYDNK